MRLRANPLIDPLSDPATAGKTFAESLLNSHITWNDLQIQLTGVQARMLVSSFWNAFFETFEREAPELLSDLKEVEWICDHSFQEEAILQAIT